LCIIVWSYLWPVITIDVGFLSGRYADKLFITCGYDTEQQLLSLAFAVVADKESVANWVGSCSGCVKRLSVMVKLPLSHINI
jgi:hypothetical protein